MPDVYLVCITAAFLTSEFLPFVRDTKANGLVHALKLLASHIVQAFSSEPDVVIEPTVRRRASTPERAPTPAPAPAVEPDHTPHRSTLRHSRQRHKRHKRRRLPSPNSGCPSKPIKTRSADAISARHHPSLRHKAQDPALNPMQLDLNAQEAQEAQEEASADEEIPDVVASPYVQSPPFTPAIELTPMMHTTV